jgi:ABC-type branched-subunit amino acid transport system substrate-binding protein
MLRRAAAAGTAAALVGATTVVVAVTGTAAAGAATSGPACQTPAPVTKAAAASTTGVTSKSITVGNVSIISGPVPGLFEGASIGVKAYFEYMNSKGGVNGRKLNVVSYDDAFSGPNNASETQTAVAKDFALVGNFSLFDSYGCKILAQNPAVPDVSVTLDPGTNSLPNDFSAQPLAVGMALGSLQYIKKLYPKARNVGTIVSNAQTAISQWNGESAALVHEGFNIAYVDEVNPLQSDFTSDILNMKAKNVNVLWLTALDWQVAADIMQDATQQGWRPTVILSGGPVYADQFIKAAGGASVANGIWIGQEQALYLGQDQNVVPADKSFLTWVKKADPTWTPDLYTLYGWASAQLFVQALQAAGKNPTRGSVLTQLKKITNFNAGGLIAPGDPSAKTPPSCYLMGRIVKGNFQRVSTPAPGFRCNSTYYYADGTP